LIIFAAVSGADTSAAYASDEMPAGLFGATTSTSVNLSIGLPLSDFVAASFSVSLRPTIPAAPVMRMCIGPPCKSGSLGTVMPLRGRGPQCEALQNRETACARRLTEEGHT